MFSKNKNKKTKLCKNTERYIKLTKLFLYMCNAFLHWPSSYYCTVTVNACMVSTEALSDHPLCRSSTEYDSIFMVSRGKKRDASLDFQSPDHLTLFG